MSQSVVAESERSLRRAGPYRSAEAQGRPSAMESLEQRLLLTTYYVATTGSNSNSGLDLAHPFATIQQAASLAQPGDTVLIRGGTYRETVIPRFSGRADAPIVYQPYNGETVTIDGADPIAAAAWTLDTGKIYQASMPWTLGDGDQVFVDGVMMNYACWPNTTGGPSNPGHSSFGGVTSYTLNGTTGTATIGDSSLTQADNSLVGATINVGLGRGWYYLQGTVTANSYRSLTFTWYDGTGTNGNYLPQGLDTYYLNGKFNLLDAASEWYRDPTTNTLYLWTPNGASPATHTVEAKARQYAFDLSNRSYTELKGLNIFASTINSNANSSYDVMDGITANYVGSYSTINNIYSHVVGLGSYGAYGIIIRGNNNSLVNSTIAFSAGDGVYLNGDNCQVFNNTIHDVDWMAGEGSAIDVTGTNDDISYNTVYNTGRNGIRLPGIKAGRVMHNLVHDVGLQTGDLGLIYTFGNDGQGTRIAYNVVHDNKSRGYTDGLDGSVGIYLDNSSANYIIDHNVVYNVQTGFKNNGGSNQYYNNTSTSTFTGISGTGGSITAKNDIFNKGSTVGATLTQTNDIWNAATTNFVDPTNFNFQLQSTSAAIDAGAVLSPYTDAYVGAAPDIGAYEYGAPVWVAGAGTNHQPVMNWGAAALVAAAMSSTTDPSSSVDPLSGTVAQQMTSFSDEQDMKNKRRSNAASANPALIGSEPLESRVLPTTWYVATTGSNSNTGTDLAHPFATIQQAATLAQPGDTVLIRAGTYHETVTPRFSGRDGAPIVYQPYNGESVAIDGADPIAPAAWALNGGNIYKASMPWTLGDGDQVFVDGQMMNYARWPNTTLNVSSPTLATIGTASYVANGASSTATITDSALTQPSGFFVGDTITSALGLVWVSQQGTVTSSQPGSLGFSYTDLGSSYHPTAGNSFYLTGNFNLLDTAGEWFRDSTTGTLYLWTPSGDSPANHTVEAKARQDAFDLSGRGYVVIKGINLFASTIATDAFSSHIVIDGITANYVSHYSQITNAWGQGVSNTGIELNGNYVSLVNSTIAYSAGNGVEIGGNHVQVFNNVVHDADYMAGDSAPIDASTNTPTDVDISYNTVYNAGRSGILHRTIRRSRIEHNEIYNYGLQTHDLGGTYTFGSDGQGTEIAYNLVHDAKNSGVNVGLYLDNGSSNYVVDHNVAWNVDRGMIVNTTALGHKIYNNTLVGHTYGVTAWPLPGSMAGTEFKNDIFTGSLTLDSSATLSNNILSTTDPKFVSASAYNFQLQSSSPAINAGASLPPYTNGYLGSAPDIGAYEYGAPVWTAASGKNHQAVLNNSVSPAFPTVPENSTTHLGLLVKDLLAQSAGGNPITDADPDAVQGIAVVGTVDAGGRWEYSLDNGTTWNKISAASDFNAYCLASDGQTRIRYVPVQSTGQTTVTISFRAWDRTLGANGSQMSTLISGANSPFSTAVETATASFTPVNDPPSLIGGAIENTQVLDAGVTSLNLGQLDFSPGSPDEQGQALKYTVTAVPDPARGSIVRAGDLVPLAVGQTISLSDLRGLRFSAASSSTSAADAFSFSVTDNGTTNGLPDPKTVSFTLPLEIVHRTSIFSLGDLETAPDSSDPANYVEMGGIAYFTASDAAHGNELWRSDGTAAGTWLVDDICPGTRGSSISGMTIVGGTLFFSANDGTDGQELWKTDGTAAGTVMVEDIAPYSTGGVPNSSSPGNLTAVNGLLFFIARNITDIYNNSNGTELWCSDGTAAGTYMVKDIYSGGGSSSPARLTAIGNTVYFTASDGINGTELWKSDGSVSGTVMVKDLTAGSGSSTISAMAAVGNTLYFVYADATTGTELWESDGTAAGTTIVKDIVAGSGSSSPANLTPVGNLLFFTANDGVSGTELWKTDGTAAGTGMVSDIYAGSSSSNPSNLTNVNGTLFFSAVNTGVGTELWKSDGTAAGTAMVKDIYPGATGSLPANLTNVAGTLFFTANDGTHGNELWKTDGTATGSSLVKDVASGSASGLYASFASVGGKLFFRGSSTSTDRQPWISDGTAAGTVMISDLTLGATATSNPTSPVDLNGTTYFVATTAASGTELWQSDGTIAGTKIVKDINLGAASAGVANLRVVGGSLYFTATDGTHGTELWKSDGTASGTAMVTDINPGPNSSSFPGSFTVVGSTIYFTATDGTHGTELWVTDGTAAGTIMLSDINPGSAGSSPASFVAVGGTLYFTANDGTHGTELWKTDGTVAGTALVDDLTAGSASSSIGNMTAYNGILLFTYNDGTTGTELWRTDGTVAGTYQVKDIQPGTGSSAPSSLTVLNGYVYFSASDGTTGSELWRTDGTAAGTALFVDIYSGTSSSSPSSFVALGSLLLFTASTGNGRELWRTDGTVAGTIQLANPDADRGLDPASFTVVGSVAYFVGTTDAAGSELWRTDGTVAGTYLLKDIQSGSGSSFPSNFTVDGSRIFFRANDGATGNELWVTDGTAAGTRLFSDLIPGSTDGYPQQMVASSGRLFFRAASLTMEDEPWVWSDAAPTTNGITNVAANSNDLPTSVDLWAAFQDDIQLDSALGYSITANSNPALFSSVTINAATGKLVLAYNPQATSGSSTITVRATDASAQWVETSFTVQVTRVYLAPTLATPAAASPATVTGTSTALSVLGADLDSGESNLIYTWAATSAPSGAAPAYSANGTNAAKGTTVTFKQPGNYTFTVTIADPQAQTVTSSVNVTVVQTLASLAVSPSGATLAPGGQQSFAASGTDQFGASMAPSGVVWSVVGGPGTINASTGVFTAAASWQGLSTITATAGAVAASVVVNTTTLPAPKAWYRFEDASGTTARDSSGNNYSGTLSAGGASFATGFSGGGIALNGSSGNVGLGSPAGLNITGVITLSAWVYPKSTSGTQDIVGRSYTSSPNAETILRINAGQYQVGSWNGTSYMAAATMPSTDLNTWVLLTGVYDGTAWKLYKNGSLVATTTAAVGSLSVAKNWVIGSGDGVGRYFSGSIDDVRIYNAALTPAQVTALYNGYYPPSIATGASASPSPLAGTTTNLSVLGADGGGESNLTYTWSTLGTPPAPVSFSANGTNAAKNTVASFGASGTYSFQVTVVDANGLAATDHVNVTVSPAGMSWSAGAAYSVSGGGSSNPTLSVTAGTVTFGQDLAASLPNATVSVAAGASVLFTSSQTLAALSLADGGTAKLQASGTPLLKVGSLSLTGTATLDLGSGGLAIGYGTGASTYSQVKSWILAARGSGGWTGSGITSSAAQANSLQVTLGYAEASDANPSGGLFLGQSVDTAHSVLVRATWWGDGNLDGKVNGRDFLAMTAAALFNKGPSALATWYNGDYTGDGRVNGQDFLKLTAAGMFNKASYDSTVTAAAAPAVVSAEATGASAAVAVAAAPAVQQAAVALSVQPQVVTYAAAPAARGRRAAEPVVVPVSAATLTAFARGGAAVPAKVGAGGTVAGRRGRTPSAPAPTPARPLASVVPGSQVETMSWTQSSFAMSGFYDNGFTVTATGTLAGTGAGSSVLLSMFGCSGLITAAGVAFTGMCRWLA